MTVSPEMAAEFEAKMEAADAVPGWDEAREGVDRLEDEIHRRDGWFLGAEQRAEVDKLKQRLVNARGRFAEVDRRRQELRREAYATVGVWSAYGVSQARQLFWDCLEKGKGFVRRSSFWDLFFGLTMGRDEGIGRLSPSPAHRGPLAARLTTAASGAAEFVVRLVINFVINVTLGLLGSVLAFVWCDRRHPPSPPFA